jgi:hypothetical protein
LSKKQKSPYKGDWKNTGAPIENECWKKILEYLIENAEEIYGNLIKIESIVV